LLPQALPFRSRFGFGLLIDRPILERDIAGILPKIPGHSGEKLLQIDVVVADRPLGHEPAVAVNLAPRDRDLTIENEFCEMSFGGLAEFLADFTRVDAVEADFLMFAVTCLNRDGIAVRMTRPERESAAAQIGSQ
jgi:hypothetical protein